MLANYKMLSNLVVATNTSFFTVHSIIIHGLGSVKMKEIKYKQMQSN